MGKVRCRLEIFMNRLLSLLLMFLLLSGHSQAQIERRDHKIIPSGLSVAFPEGYDCQPISSPFASPMRYDGSSRRGDRNQGLHGGMDISLKTGTPLLAVAGGKVIAVGEGGRLEGIYL
jgi:murein DD-endopeptidase MepM/ murein hydrolase activator NlpD